MLNQNIYELKVKNVNIFIWPGLVKNVIFQILTCHTPYEKIFGPRMGFVGGHLKWILIPYLNCRGDSDVCHNEETKRLLEQSDEDEDVNE